MSYEFRVNGSGVGQFDLRGDIYVVCMYLQSYTLQYKM